MGDRELCSVGGVGDIGGQDGEQLEARGAGLVPDSEARREREVDPAVRTVRISGFCSTPGVLLTVQLGERVGRLQAEVSPGVRVSVSKSSGRADSRLSRRGEFPFTSNDRGGV